MTPAAEERMLAALERVAAALESDRSAETAAIDPGECANLAHLCVDSVGLGSMLGVSERAVRRLDDSGRIPAAIDLGSSKRWYAAEIRAWLEAGAPPRRRWEQIRRWDK